MTDDPLGVETQIIAHERAVLRLQRIMAANQRAAARIERALLAELDAEEAALMHLRDARRLNALGDRALDRGAA